METKLRNKLIELKAQHKENNDKITTNESDGDFKFQRNAFFEEAIAMLEEILGENLPEDANPLKTYYIVYKEPTSTGYCTIDIEGDLNNKEDLLQTIKELQDKEWCTSNELIILSWQLLNK